jgi:pimeloyl-ACP methyl ester carboxylesterase
MKPTYLAISNRSRADLLDLLVDMAMKLGPSVFIEQSLALRDRQSFADILPTFSGPAIVLVGAEDQLCPPERHREIASLLPSATYAEIQGAGHITTLETPEAIIAALRGWLEPRV